MPTHFCSRRQALRTLGFAALACALFPRQALAGLDRTLPSLDCEPVSAVPVSEGYGPCDLERRLLDHGLVDVQTVDPLLLVDLKYARNDNFMGENVYGGLRKGYLHPEPAEKLGKAHALLKERDPDLGLLLVDGVRPRSVQWRMWEFVRNTPMQPYVADPARGSMHNFGAAVDVTIVKAGGVRLDMGTGVDHFGVLAQPREEKRLLMKGRLTAEQVANRRLLREVMLGAGFRPLSIEWWHFDALAKDEARRRYAIIE